MKSKKCEIIQDLLPSYIENLTNIETNNFIENHLGTCNFCKEKLRNMSSELEIDKIDEMELNYLKKYNKNIKKSVLLGMLIIICILLITYIGVVYYRFNILHTLNSEFQKYERNNVYIEINTIDLSDVTGKGSYISKYWYKDGVLKYESYYNDSSSYSTILIDFNKQIEYIINENNVIQSNELSMSQDILDSILGVYYLGGPYELYSQLRNSFDLYGVHIYQNNQLSGKQYYVIDVFGEHRIYDKDSKLLRYNIQELGDRFVLHTYKYSFNSVTDNDIKLP